MVDAREREVVLREVLVEAGVVDAHTQDRRVFLWHQHRVSYPGGFLDLSNKTSFLQPIAFFADGLALRLQKATQRLLHRFSVRVDIECVLSKFPRNTWHVGWFPCKYFPALTEELDERAFLLHQ